MKLTKRKVFAIIFASVILTVALSACDILLCNKESKSGMALASIRNHTDSGQVKADSPETQQPNKSIHPALIGPWRGALSGFSYYIMFRDDGTFAFLIQSPNDDVRNAFREGFVLRRGNWYFSEDIIYMTEMMMLGWNGSETPPNDSVWKKIDNDSLHVRMYEDEEAKEYDLPYRKMEILNIVSDSQFSKGAALIVRHENLPSWAYLGEIRK